MDPINTEMLVSLVEERPVIWDKTIEAYKNKNVRASAWREICVVLKEDFEEMEENKRQEFGKLIVKKWTQTRDTWMRCIKNQKKIKKSGALANASRLYIFHNQMSFLKKIIGTNVAHESTHATRDEERERNDEVENEENDETIPRKGHAPESEKSDKSIDTSNKKKDVTNNRKRRRNEKVDAKMMSFIDYQMNPPTTREDENQHLSFFKGLLPSLSALDDDETLEFQAGVINVLRNLKKSKEMRQVSRPVRMDLNEKQRLGAVTHHYLQTPIQPLQSENYGHLAPPEQHLQLTHPHSYLPQQQQRGYFYQQQLTGSYHEQIPQPETPAPLMDTQSPTNSEISGADSILSGHSQGALDDELNF